MPRVFKTSDVEYDYALGQYHAQQEIRKLSVSVPSTKELDANYVIAMERVFYQPFRNWHIMVSIHPSMHRRVV